MLIPVIVGLGVVSIFKGRTSAPLFGQMTAERSHLFQSALNSAVLTPPQLETLATAFQAQGLSAEATLLRKRAKLRGLSPEEKRVRGDIFRKALNCKDPDVVDRLAAVYEAQGATGSAKRLRMLAISLRTVKQVQPIAPTQDIAPDASVPAGGSPSSNSNGPSPMAPTPNAEFTSIKKQYQGGPSMAVSAPPVVHAAVIGDDSEAPSPEPQETEAERTQLR
jgi:hypothetical protein